jgi:hypothetical protein
MEAQARAQMLCLIATMLELNIVLEPPAAPNALQAQARLARDIESRS